MAFVSWSCFFNRIFHPEAVHSKVVGYRFILHLNHHVFFAQSSENGHFGWFLICVFCECSSNKHRHTYFFDRLFSFLLNLYLPVGQMGHEIGLLVTFEDPLDCFP